MSRNNEDRLGATMIDAEVPPQATGQLNPTPNNNLSFVQRDLSLSRLQDWNRVPTKGLRPFQSPTKQTSRVSKRG